MIHNDEDSEKHEVFGANEFKKNRYNNNKRKTHNESKIFYVFAGGSGGFAGAQHARARVEDG
jgi:hypothetical protein